MTLGKRIKLLLKHGESTQRNLAHFCYKTSETKISRIINGKTEPTLEQLEDIARYFHLTIDELLGKCPILDELLEDYEVRLIN